MGVWIVSWFLLSVFLKRNDIVDIAWGLGYIYLSVFFSLDIYLGPLQYIVYGLVSIWALRLSIYLFLRLKGKAEDFRYHNWRKEWGNAFYMRSFFQIYLLQSVFLMIIALPLAMVNLYEGMGLKISVIPGICFWLFGFYWQSKADYQMVCFKSKPENKGRIIQSGLWAYSRHPNYFGELCMWWGIWLCLSPYPMAWLGLISPVLISWLIIKVSGIPMLEKKYEAHPEFEAYKKRVPALIPQFWKRP
jgi:steroid 5-alpha reductase family enzyme